MVKMTLYIKRTARLVVGHAGDRTFQSSMVSAAVSKLRASDVPLRKKGSSLKLKRAGGPQWRWEWVMREGWEIPKATHTHTHTRGNSVHKSLETEKKKKCLERLQIVDNFSIAGAGCLRWEGWWGLMAVGWKPCLLVKELEFILRATWKHWNV